MSSPKKSVKLERMLISAIQRNNLRMAKRLLDNFKVNVNCADEDGIPCLHWAIKRRDTQMLKLLLQRNVDINPKRSEVRLPLSWAVSLGRQKAAELLIRAGANLNAGFSETSALEIAVKSSNAPMTQLLLDSGARIPGSILESAYASQSSITVIKAILDRLPVQPITARHQVRSLIEALCQHDNQEAIQLLIDHPKINLLWDPAKLHGVTVLHFATSLQFGKDNAMVVRLLLERGVEIDAAENGDCMTALHMALVGGKLNMARELINSGANVNAKTASGGISPLFIAAKIRSPEMIELLISKGADLHATTTPDQLTALHNACYEDSEDCIRVLLANGADPLAKDMAGRTALQLLTNLEGEAAGQVVRRLAAFAATEQRKLDDEDLESIAQSPSLLEYYNVCVAEIERMRRTKVYNDLTLFRLQFVVSEDRLAKLMNNEDFASSLKSKLCEESFLLYRDLILAKCQRAEEKMRTRRAIKEHLQPTLAPYFPELILDRLVDYMKIIDLPECQV